MVIPFYLVWLYGCTILTFVVSMVVHSVLCGQMVITLCLVQVSMVCAFDHTRQMVIPFCLVWSVCMCILSCVVGSTTIRHCLDSGRNGTCTQVLKHNHMVILQDISGNHGCTTRRQKSMVILHVLYGRLVVLLCCVVSMVYTSCLVWTYGCASRLVKSYGYTSVLCGRMVVLLSCVVSMVYTSVLCGRMVVLLSCVDSKHILHVLCGRMVVLQT